MAAEISRKGIVSIEFGQSLCDPRITHPHEAILSIFLDQINSSGKNIDRLVKTPTTGSGFTFICTLHTDFLLNPKYQDSAKKTIEIATSLLKTDLFPIRPYRFILKWNKDHFSANEKLGAELLSSFGLDTPKIHILDNKPLQTQLSTFTQGLKMKNSFDPEYCNSLIFMEAFSGGTFLSHLQTGDLLELSKEDYIALLTNFGQAVIFDLLMGNHDRLVRLDLRQKNFLEIPPAFNDGNIMLHIPLNEKTGKRHFEGICFIDNATFPDIFTKENIIYDDQHLDTLFGSDDAYESFPTYVKEESKEEERKTSKEEESKSSFEKSEKPLTELTAEKLKESFAYLISNLDVLEENVYKAIEKSFIEGLKTELLSDKGLKSKVDPFLKLIKASINKGFVQAIAKIIKYDLKDFKNKHPEFKGRPLALIEANIDFVRKMKNEV